MNIAVDFYQPTPKFPKWLFWLIFSILLIIAILWLCVYLFPDIEASESIILTASWYSVDSLKKEGTYKYSKGVCADGSIFNDENYTCAVSGYKFGTILKVTNLKTGASVQVMVTDRIGKRFAKTRIDLSVKAFSILASLSEGIIQVKIERIKRYSCKIK